MKREREREKVEEVEGHFQEQFEKQDRAHCLKNHLKCLIQHCERSELRLHFEWTKVHKNTKIENFQMRHFG